MEGIKKFVKNTIYPACFIFTLILLVSSLIHALFSLSVPLIFKPVSLFQFFLFSFLLSWSSIVFKDKKMSFVGAHFLHYAIFLLNVFVSFILFDTKRNIFVTLLVFSVFYLVGALVALIVRKVSPKKPDEKKTSYKKQFK